jgi:hypothetical protein
MLMEGLSYRVGKQAANGKSKSKSNSTRHVNLTRKLRRDVRGNDSEFTSASAVTSTGSAKATSASFRGSPDAHGAQCDRLVQVAFGGEQRWLFVKC